MNRIALLSKRFLTPIPLHLSGRVRVEQVDTLANLGGAIGCVGVLAAFGLFASFWRSAPHLYLLAFLSTFVVIYAAAFRRSVIWRRRTRPHDMPLRAYRIRNLHVGIIGLLWSTMPVCLAPHADANQILLIVYVSSGLIASSVVIAPTLLAAFSISVPVMLGTIVAMLMTRGSAGPVLAALVVVYSSLIFISTLHSHRSFIQRTVGKMEFEEQREVVGLLLREFEQESSDWLWRTDAFNRLEHISERMIRVFGAVEGDLRGKDFVSLIFKLTDPAASASAVARLSETICARESFRDLLVPLTIQGRHCWWHVTGKPMFGEDGTFRGYRGVGSDVTAAKQSQAQIAHMASHDSLTGLPNRFAFHEALAAAFAGPSHAFALLWADLDQFKDVNDTLGHAAGDTLLMEVAKRLLACVSSEDLVARLGGDEFVILLSGANSESANTLAGRIIAAVSEPYHVDGMRVGIGVSIGISAAPDDASAPDELFKNADLALYRAKSDGRGTWRFYEADMDVRAQERRALQRDLRLALERRQFHLMFQPIVDLSLARVGTAEALLRWTHSERGLVSPDSFIRLAEETGLIVQIGEWVIRQACLEAAHWPGHTCVAVNLSPVQFRDTSLSSIVDSALSESGLPPERLVLEITESVFLDADDGVLKTLHALRERGVSFALDDFGTGYSSLSYLRSFPFDKVKIDKSFVREIAHHDSNLAIVRAITGMANSLGMTVIAEGVETEEELIVLRLEGCMHVQGYLFSRPLSASAISQYIQMVAASGLRGGESASTQVALHSQA
jgi:diguanylate cyclase (GGDEF)-like protein/PAS domain S-box-containing protein